MAVIHSDPKILGLSFQKDIPEIAFYDFEKLIVFGVFQTLNLLTDVAFLDYAVPAHRMMMKQHLSREQRAMELRQLGSRFQCSHILYGALKPEINPRNQLESIAIELNLYDLERNQYPLRLSYNFTAFDGPNASPHIFSPTWSGLQDLIQWMAFHIAGAIEPEKATSLWARIQRTSIANNIVQYQKLANAHYLSTEAGLSPKISLLVELTQEDPNLFVAHLELGLLYKRMKNYAQAIVALEWAWNVMKDVTPHQRALCATELGICYALAGQHDKACIWWKNAIQENPRYLNPYMNLAHSLEEQGNIDEAEFYFLQAGEIAPDDNRICFNLARLYSKQEQWEKAIHQYECQLLLEDENPWIYSNLANCYLQKGDIMEAKSYLLKTLERDSEGEAGRCARFILSGLQAAEV